MIYTFESLFFESILIVPVLYWTRFAHIMLNELLSVEIIWNCLCKNYLIALTRREDPAYR